MAKKRKMKKFSKVGVVKEMARERIGAPPTLQVIPNTKKKTKEKHKKTLGTLLDME